MIKINVQATGTVPGVSKRKMQAHTRAMWVTLGIHWHRKLRPKHFMRAHQREYGIWERSGETQTRRRQGNWKRTYTGQKLRKYGHTKPLVKTGTGMRLTRLRDVRATRNSARIVLHAPVFNFRKSPSHPDMRRELTTISKPEGEALVQLGNRTLERNIASDKSRQRLNV